MKYAQRLFAATALLFVVACNTPGPAFRGVEPVRITVQGDTFDVRVDGLQAEAMRLNTRWAPRLDAVAPQGTAAIEQVSGCRVRKLDGDAALMTARLDCGQRLAPLPRGNTYDCDVYEIVGGLAELTCEAVRA
ncbi:hypothetical protein [Roseovarius sp. Pro17]|uniref:hypothetical protein n=1 Tax=Roseovarius sp. Pro17 TaxID=3108175 RepID=UPI002D77255F|nr:hypothetical protein [Roseovarius sp. Pro17]